MYKPFLMLLLAGALFAQNPATAVYPTAIATDTDLGVLCNSAHTKLAASMTALDTSIAVANGAAGVAFGRNVWGAEDPAAMVASLRKAVHGKEAKA